MSNSNDIFNEMNTFWDEFHENHMKFSNKGTKAAGARARKAIYDSKRRRHIDFSKLNKKRCCH